MDALSNPGELIETAFSEISSSSFETPERSERWARLRSEPKLFESILAYISSGGTLPELAEVWDVPDGWVRMYMMGTDKNRYMEAEMERRSWFEEKLVGELRNIGTFDVRKVLNSDGSLKPISEWPNSMKGVVDSIEVKEFEEGVPVEKGGDGVMRGVIKKVKFTPRLKAIEMLGKQMGMFVEMKRVEGRVTLENLLSEIGSGPVVEEAVRVDVKDGSHRSGSHPQGSLETGGMGEDSGGSAEGGQA